MQEDEDHLEEEPEEQEQQQQYENNNNYSSDPDLQPVDNSQVYSVFGRDTAAGRALFKIYNKNKVNYAPKCDHQNYSDAYRSTERDG